ncbi:integrase core domain-containing protein [Marinomonas algicola]|uniref:integrase core domain-containing protein n=1 Tax=Marinomonas algicola TaxID=2773454 RepID=UPI0023D9154E|nr:integrase core domain-containing protein [Marinomonas algicola]
MRRTYSHLPWLAEDNTAVLPLPAATTLQGLYQLLLEALLPQLPSYQVPTKTATRTEAPGINETLTSKAIEESGSISKSPTIVKTVQPPSLQEKLAALAEIEILNKQLAQVKSKRDKEKQFNRRQALNDQWVSKHLFETLNEVECYATKWLWFYNNERPHKV